MIWVDNFSGLERRIPLLRYESMVVTQRHGRGDLPSVYHSNGYTFNYAEGNKALALPES